MDMSRHQFGFQPYLDRPELHVTMSCGSFVYSNDGTVRWAKSFFDPEPREIISIDDRSSADALGVLRPEMSPEAMAEQIASHVLPLSKREFEVVYRSTSEDDSTVTPTDLRNLPTVAQLAKSRARRTR